jgi:hypothetical protein
LVAGFDAGLTACLVHASFEAAVSSVFSGRSDDWQNITTNLDIAGTGITAPRADQLSGYLYGPNTTINDLSRDTIALPKPGTYRATATKIRVTGASARHHEWRILSNVRRWRFCVETFNLFNNFNWAIPGYGVRPKPPLVASRRWPGLPESCGIKNGF